MIYEQIYKLTIHSRIQVKRFITDHPFTKIERFRIESKSNQSNTFYKRWDIKI